MKPTDVFPLIGETVQAMAGHYRNVYQEKITEAGFGDGPEWFMLSVSLDFEPETTSVARFTKRGPYSAPKVYEEGIANLVEKGYLEAARKDEYRITDKGHAITDEVLGVFYNALDELAPQIDTGKAERTVALLGRLVEAALAAPEPADKSRLVYNRNSDPGPDGSVLLRMLQYAADLNSFRDDSHVAAWQTYGVSGPVWEALTFLWREEAKTAAELAEKLPFRQYSADDYAKALDKLDKMGWSKAVDGGYQVTEEGKKVRQDAEDQTDRYYYAAWDALSANEVAELGKLLTALRDQLKALLPESEEETT